MDRCRSRRCDDCDLLRWCHEHSRDLDGQKGLLWRREISGCSQVRNPVLIALIPVFIHISPGPRCKLRPTGLGPNRPVSLGRL